MTRTLYHRFICEFSQWIRNDINLLVSKPFLFFLLLFIYKLPFTEIQCVSFVFKMSFSRSVCLVMLLYHHSFH